MTIVAPGYLRDWLQPNIERLDEPRLCGERNLVTRLWVWRGLRFRFWFRLQVRFRILRDDQRLRRIDRWRTVSRAGGEDRTGDRDHHQRSDHQHLAHGETSVGEPGERTGQGTAGRVVRHQPAGSRQ